MVPIPRNHALHLARQLIVFHNTGRLGDVLGLLSPDAVVNGLKGMDIRVQTSLAWRRHPSFHIHLPENDSAFSTDRPHQITFPFTRTWLDKFTGNEVTVRGTTTITFTEDALISEIVDEYEDREAAVGWFPRDLTAFDAEAQLNAVLSESELDRWHLGGDWLVQDDGSYDLSVEDPLRDFPSVATISAIVSGERSGSMFSAHASADSLHS